MAQVPEALVNKAGGVRCPSLYSEAAPICRAEVDGLFVPPPETQARFCRTARYRHCDTFKRFLGALADQPERWRSTAAPRTLSEPSTPRTAARAGKGD